MTPLLLANHMPVLAFVGVAALMGGFFFALYLIERRISRKAQSGK